MSNIDIVVSSSCGNLAMKKNQFVAFDKKGIVLSVQMLHVDLGWLFFVEGGGRGGGTRRVIDR